ncbi:hypothetical protein D3C72_2063770 [compost metagenome]
MPQSWLAGITNIWLTIFDTFISYMSCISRITCPTKRIQPASWVYTILIEIQSTQETYRIMSNISPYAGLIISESIIVKSRFKIIVLALEPKVLLDLTDNQLL